MACSGEPFLGLQGTALTWVITLCSASAFCSSVCCHLQLKDNSLTRVIGYDQGIMGSIISTPYFLEEINLKVGEVDLPKSGRNVHGWHIGQETDTDTISTIVSIYDIGCMVVCLTAAIWGGIFGRKLMILCGMVIMVIGSWCPGQVGKNITSYLEPPTPAEERAVVEGQMVIGLYRGSLSSHVNILMESEWSKQDSHWVVYELSSRVFVRDWIEEQRLDMLSEGIGWIVWGGKDSKLLWTGICAGHSLVIV